MMRKSLLALLAVFMLLVSCAGPETIVDDETEEPDSTISVEDAIKPSASDSTAVSDAISSGF